MIIFPVGHWGTLGAGEGGGPQTLTKTWSDTLTASESIAVEKRMPWSDTLAGAETIAIVKLVGPTNLSVTLDPDLCEAALTWTDGSTNESGWKIYRSVNGGAFNLYQTFAGDRSSYTDPSLAVSTTYDYKVRPYHTPGDGGSDVLGPESNEDGVTTPSDCGPT